MESIRLEQSRSLTIENIEWMTHIEAARYLKVTPKSLYNLVYRDKLKVYKHGSRNRYMRRELNAYLLRSEQGAINAY